MSDEMNAALDELGIPGGEVIEGEVITDPIINADPPIDDLEPVVEEPEIKPENPPGYVSYEDWVEDGKDPDNWQGKNKYSQQYDLIQDNKDFKSELRGMNDLLRQTVDATTAMQDDAYKRGITEAKAELQTAIANEDVNAVVAAKDKIADLTPPQPSPKVNPVHDEFFSSNAVLDKNNSQYDPEFSNEFERIYHGKLKADGVVPGQMLSNQAVKGYMNLALKGAKELFPDKFVSPRNNRQAPQQTGKRAPTTRTAGDNIKNVKVTTQNPRDTDAVNDIYKLLQEKDKSGKSAEAFAKAMTK